MPLDTSPIGYSELMLGRLGDDARVGEGVSLRGGLEQGTWCGVSRSPPGGVVPRSPVAAVHSTDAAGTRGQLVTSSYVTVSSSLAALSAVTLIIKGYFP